MQALILWRQLVLFYWQIWRYEVNIEVGNMDVIFCVSMNIGCVLAVSYQECFILISFLHEEWQYRHTSLSLLIRECDWLTRFVSLLYTSTNQVVHFSVAVWCRAIISTKTFSGLGLQFHPLFHLAITIHIMHPESLALGWNCDVFWCGLLPAYFTHIFQDYSTGTGAVSSVGEVILKYGWNQLPIDHKKRIKIRTMSISLWMYSMWDHGIWLIWPRISDTPNVIFQFTTDKNSNVFLHLINQTLPVCLKCHISYAIKL